MPIDASLLREVVPEALREARQYSVKLSRDCIRGTISHIMQKKCAPGGNPVYRVAIAWNKRTLGKLHGVAGDGTLRPKRGGKSSRNARDDWFVVEDAHEPIVSPAMFRKAETAVAKRRHQGGLAKPVNRSLLSGLIIGRSCGHRFLQKKVNSTSGGKRVQYRYCTDGGTTGPSSCSCSVGWASAACPRATCSVGSGGSSATRPGTAEGPTAQAPPPAATRDQPSAYIEARTGR